MLESLGNPDPVPCQVCRLQNLRYYLYVKMDWKLKECMASIDDGDGEKGGKAWHVDIFTLCGLLVIVGIILVL